MVATIVVLMSFTSCGILFQSAASFQDTLTAKLHTIEGKYQSSGEGVYLQKIIETTGTKDDIYIKLLEFLTRTYNDASEVIQVKEKEQGLIVCKGCYKFNVNDFLYGSAIEETAWHIYKAEIKDGKVRITITLNTLDWYRPASSAGGVFISSARSSYSILDCPPFKEYTDKNENVRKGYVFYYAVSNILGLMNATEGALSKAPAYKVDNNW